MTERTSHEGHTAQERGDTWTYQFWVPKGEGRRYINKGGFRTKKLAQDAMTDALAAFAKGEHVEPSKMTVRSYLVDEWLPQRHDLKAVPARKGYSDIITGRIVPELGEIRLCDLTAGHIGKLYAHLSRVRQPPRQEARGRDKRAVAQAHAHRAAQGARGCRRS